MESYRDRSGSLPGKAAGPDSTAGSKRLLSSPICNGLVNRAGETVTRGGLDLYFVQAGANSASGARRVRGRRDRIGCLYMSANTLLMMGAEV